MNRDEMISDVRLGVQSRLITVPYYPHQVEHRQKKKSTLVQVYSILPLSESVNVAYIS